ncbi:TonB-dependent receptor [Hyphococcus sp.]|uniref:TonB-dependent receptor n=1 Tax=Hyphococcus sp. TaxID=2038636 RepID=UPI0035C73A8D
MTKSANNFKGDHAQIERRKTRYLAGASLAAMLVSATAPALAEEKKFDIDAGPAAKALNAFAKQADASVVFAYDAVEGYKTNGLEGEFEPDVALGKLIDGTGLSVFAGEGGAFAVRANARQADLGGVITVAQTENATQGMSVEPRATGPSGDGAPVTVTGGVKDERTGGNLKGALVEIEETGQSTSTDDLGNFRFPSVRPGSYTLRISYLGYRDVVAAIDVAPGRRFDQSFAMKGGSGDDVVVVYGSRSARAQALNQERTAENVSTVISGDLLGNFTGTTLSESLRRAPGVIFERDAQTGDGANIIVRGLEPDLNTVKLNGVELPEGSGTGRSASLSNVLTESISKVTISKTLMPNQDSSGTGALIEIETKTPLDRPRRYASFTLEGAKRANDFNESFLAAGTVSGTFGREDQFGLSASVQYRDRDVSKVRLSTDLRFGQYLPLHADGSPVTSVSQIDPRTPFPYEGAAAAVYADGFSVNLDDAETKNLALTISGAWRISDHTELSFDFQRLDQDDVTVWRQSSLSSSNSYSVRPVLALGGEARSALGWNGSVYGGSLYALRNEEKLTDVYSFRGQSEVDKWRFTYAAGYANGRRTNPERTLTTSFPNQVLDSSYVASSATDTVEGRILSLFAPRTAGEGGLPDLLLSEAGFDYFQNPDNTAFSSVAETTFWGRNEKFSGEASVRRDFENGYLDYLDFGASYEVSKFSNGYPGSVSYAGVRMPPLFSFPSLSDVGLGFSEGSLSSIGIDSPVSLISKEDLIGFIDAVPDLELVCDPSSVSGCPTGALIYKSVFDRDPRLSEAFTKENEFAAYIQGKVDVGKFEFIGGVRMSRVELEATNLNSPNIYEAGGYDIAFRESNIRLVSEKATQTEYLPRMLINYRQSDNLIFRAGYYMSIARPQVSLLSSEPTVLLFLLPFFGPNGDQPQLFVSKGNPDLKSARTHSLDFSAEYYDRDIGVLKIGAFYKNISNLLESNVTSGEAVLDQVREILPDDPRFQDVLDNPQDYDLILQVPANNPDSAKIWGIETSIEKQLTFLPGFWGGFGVYANYTFTDSSKNQPINWSQRPVLDGDGNVSGFESADITVPNVAFNGQAKHSGTAGLTYNKYGIDANLAYTKQARRQLSFEKNNLSRYEEAYGTLDLRLEYRFDQSFGDFRIYLEGADLLHGANDPSISQSVGADDGYTSKYIRLENYFGGRQFRIGVTGAF